MLKQNSMLNVKLTKFNRMHVEKISMPFTVFGIVRFFKMSNFFLKIWFSQAQHAMSDFFFKDQCFFYATSNLFSSKPPSIFTRNEAFCEHKGLLKAVGTIQLTRDLQEKIRKKIP